MHCKSMVSAICAGFCKWVDHGHEATTWTVVQHTHLHASNSILNWTAQQKTRTLFKDLQDGLRREKIGRFPIHSQYGLYSPIIFHLDTRQFILQLPGRSGSGNGPDNVLGRIGDDERWLPLRSAANAFPASDKKACVVINNKVEMICLLELPSSRLLVFGRGNIHLAWVVLPRAFCSVQVPWERRAISNVRRSLGEEGSRILSLAAALAPSIHNGHVWEESVFAVLDIWAWDYMVEWQPGAFDRDGNE